jgi:gamma-glutamylcyclotransferase (GGCT)/AIG2-like uncharacterized protein YtfP
MLVFVYGTLKRGLRLNHHLAGQEFIGVTATQPFYELFNCGWYPGLVECSNGISITGEIWQVDETGLTILDEVEGSVGETPLFVRRPISLLAPYDEEKVIAYFYVQDVSQLRRCGPSWPEDGSADIG